jgi:tRNA modification GTPase
MPVAMFSTTDTIVAVATPSGRGGLGVVRLSGPTATGIAQALSGRADPFRPRRATLARILDATGGREPSSVDQVIITLFAAPHSYTGEDVVEISGHGSPLLMHQIVGLAMRNGARLAEPGEFTFRAYLNGRMDLIQAEAVADLVDAVTPLQARAAMDQLEGTLTAAIGRIDVALFDLCARLEASLDFPDEGFHFVTREQAREELARVLGETRALARQGRAGRVIREGRAVAIVGRPNAGKSSLFNALLGNARAIVTDIPGTTRDLLTEPIDIGGVPVTLVDTAGLREVNDAIEAEGVTRARDAARAASLTLAMIDGSLWPNEEDRRLASIVVGSFEGAKMRRGEDASDSPARVVVISKTDLPRAWRLAELGLSREHVVEVSALTGAGLDALRDRIVAELTDREELRDTPRMSNIRHVALVDEALTSLERANAALAAGATEELVLIDLAAARRSFEEITGRRSAEDLLRHIFQRFCIGK